MYHCFVMTSSNGNIFRVTSHLCGEFTGHRWIPHTKASDAELWCFLWSAPEGTIEKTIVGLVIWDAIVSIMTSELCHDPWPTYNLRPISFRYGVRYYTKFNLLFPISNMTPKQAGQWRRHHATTVNAVYYHTDSRIVKAYPWLSTPFPVSSCTICKASTENK